MKPAELTPEIIAAAMDISINELWSMASKMESHFLPTRRCSVKGKIREIDAPKRKCKARLRKLHRFFQKEFRPPTYIHGGVRGRSCFTNAESHLGKSVILTRDVENCYPSISTRMLKIELLKLGFRSATAKLLSHLMTVHGRIPQGSPISSDALNFFLSNVDRKIALNTFSRKANYGRVYDDMVISTHDPDCVEQLIQCVEDNVEGLGLKVSEKKKLQIGFQPRSRIQVVHGIVVNDAKGTRISKKIADESRRMANNYISACKRVAPHSLLSVVRKRQALMGMICHCMQARYGPEKHLRKQMKFGDRIVRTRLEQVGLTCKKGRWWIKSKKNDPVKLANKWCRIMASPASIAA